MASKTLLSQLVSLISDDQQPIARKLVEELIFMQDLLKALKQKIKSEGVVDTSSGVAKESAAVRSYNSTVQRYGNLLKQFEMMLRKDSVKIEDVDALKEWLEEQK